MTRITATEIDGVRVKASKTASDSRGSFIKVTPDLVFQDRLDSVAVSINPRAGTIRGLHFQTKPFAEEKIVTCIQGLLFDVIVDIRPNSKTFGKIASFELSAENSLQVYLPQGIAHGFQTLQDNTIVHYCLSANYSTNSSFSINPFGELGIDWPLPNYTVSEKDSNGISFSIAVEKYSNDLEN